MTIDKIMHQWIIPIIVAAVRAPGLARGGYGHRGGTVVVRGPCGDVG
jgi:hypothetical protein